MEGVRRHGEEAARRGCAATDPERGLCEEGVRCDGEEAARRGCAATDPERGLCEEVLRRGRSRTRTLRGGGAPRQRRGSCVGHDPQIYHFLHKSINHEEKYSTMTIAARQCSKLTLAIFASAKSFSTTWRSFHASQFATERQLMSFWRWVYFSTSVPSKEKVP